MYCFNIILLICVILPVAVFSADREEAIRSIKSTDSEFVEKYIKKTQPEELVAYIMHKPLLDQASFYDFVTEASQTLKNIQGEPEYIRSIETEWQKEIDQVLQRIGFKTSIKFDDFYYQINYAKKNQKFLDPTYMAIMTRLHELHQKNASQQASTCNSKP